MNRHNEFMTFGSILMDTLDTEKLFCHHLARPAAGLQLTPLALSSPAWASLKLCGKPFDKPAPNWGCLQASSCLPDEMDIVSMQEILFIGR